MTDSSSHLQGGSPPPCSPCVPIDRKRILGDTSPYTHSTEQRQFGPQTLPAISSLVQSLQSPSQSVPAHNPRPVQIVQQTLNTSHYNAQPRVEGQRRGSSDHGFTFGPQNDPFNRRFPSEVDGSHVFSHPRKAPVFDAFAHGEPDRTLPILRQPQWNTISAQTPPTYHATKRPRLQDSHTAPSSPGESSRSGSFALPRRSFDHGHPHNQSPTILPKLPPLKTINKVSLSQIPQKPPRLVDTPSKDKHRQEAEEVIVKLVRLLETSTIHNFGEILMEVLKECHNDVPLDDFYNLLYNYLPPGFEASSVAKASRIDKSGSYECKSKGLHICHLVLEIFRSPADAARESGIEALQNLRLPPVNFHELLRTFLAMKIILCSVREVQSESLDSSAPQPALLRLSLYKVYYTLCQQLIKQYPSDSTSSITQQSIIVGQSGLGRITKLVYPNIITKRLGRRGHSKHHCLGLTWNPAIVDQELLGLLDFELPQLKVHLKGLREQSHSIQRGRSIANSSRAPQILNPKSVPLTPDLPSKTPLYSYVNSSCRYPSMNCSPRTWDTAYNALPQQSKWAKDTMEKSLGVLKSHNVDLQHLIHDINARMFFYDDHNGLSSTVLRAMNVLMDASTAKEIYLHLYLVVLLLIFPLIISSDQEVPCASKLQLRASIDNLILGLAAKRDNISSLSGASLNSFMTNLRKMTHISEMISSNVYIFTQREIEELLCDFQNLSDLRIEALGGLSPLEEIVIRGITISFNAFNFDIPSLGSDTAQNNAIFTMAKIFTEAVSKTTQGTSMLYKSNTHMMATDIPYQALKISAQVLHEHVLSNPIILQMPMSLFTYLVQHLQTEMHNASFHYFGSSDIDLPEGTFKSWWVYCTMFREYLGILSEVVALSQTLA